MRHKRALSKRQTIAVLRRRLPHIRTDQIRDVYEVLTEIWRDELARPGASIAIGGLGQMYVEFHVMRAGGAVRKMLVARHGAQAPTSLIRRVVRFRASQALQCFLNQTLAEESNHGH